jgi:Zn-finger nucleic acid-binding protein
MAGYCPRDRTPLQTVSEHGIEIDRCTQCHGAWYDYDELAELEATVGDEDERRGTVEYSKHESDLPCPVCEQPMHAFNYRAYNLELDACAEGHGFWLDAGESERVRDIMKERVRGLHRAEGAQKAWSHAKGRGGGGVIDQIKNMFGGRR